MINHNNKVFVLSLDGATFDVLYPLARQGYLPNLGRLFQTSLCAELESVIPPVTAPAWTSFMTGKNPDKHGIFDFLRFDHDDYKAKINNSRHIRSKTIWQLLSEHNRRLVILNLPYTYPTYEVNGVMVAGWDAPTNASFTFPEEASKEIFDVVPDFGSSAELSLWNYLPADSQSDFNNFVAKLESNFSQCAALASHFLATKTWDVFMVHFQQTDWIQHKLWSYIARACAESDDHSERVEGVRKCYRTFDTHVAQLLQQVAPANPIQIILSDHGFGGNFGTICPNHLLREMDLYHLHAGSNRLTQAVKSSRQGGIRKLVNVLRNVRTKMQGQRTLKNYKSWADMAADTVPHGKSLIDWSRTKAAFVAGSEVGFIYVNVKGRGPLGCVEPGAEYEQLITDVIAQSRKLANPHTGERLLVRVCRGDEIYTSRVEGVLVPDVVLFPSDGYVIGAGLSEPFIAANGERGNHRHNGILLMQGPGLRDSVPDLRPRLIDLAPTVLHALGLPVPSDMDGRVLEEVFCTPRSVRFETADNSQTAEIHEYADTETELIEQRLRGLGYVE